MSKPCPKGGLGVLDLGEMNAALLVKWIYCYGSEPDRLWRRVVCAKSAADLNSLSWTWDRRSRRPVLGRIIGLMMDKKENVADLVNRAFRHVVDNGLHSEFWTDNWT